MDGGLLYYRSDLLRRDGDGNPPQTWNALLASARCIQQAVRRNDPDFHGFVWTGARYEGLITAFMEFAKSRGGFVMKDGGIRLNVPANVAALGFMRDLIWKHKISPPDTYTSMREEEVRLRFQRGGALYERNWPYAWALHQAPDSPVRGHAGVSPPPAREHGECVSTLGGFHIGVSAWSDSTANAIRFVKFVTSYRTQKRLPLALGWNPGRQDLDSDPRILEQAPHFRELADVFRNARPRPLVPHYPQISAIAQRHINRVLADKAEPKDALAACDRDIQALMERYGRPQEGRR